MSDTPETEHFACALQMQSMQNQIKELTNVLRNTERGLADAQNLFCRVSSVCSELKQALAAVTEQRDRLAEELKEAQDAIGLMLKDSSCCTIPRYTKENLIIQTGEEL